MPDYKPQTIEQKWQERWRERARLRGHRGSRRKPKFYCLEMFAYPSGHAHVGHVRNYMIGDVVARMKRMRGFNVLHPFGWDAFGLPAENAAIKNGTHPETWTLENIAHMKGQLQRLGISYAWEREIATCLPEYYHWNQWLFLKMLERGLAYRKRSTVNWCPSCQTVLANEQVVDGALLALRHAGRRRASWSSGSSASRSTPTSCSTRHRTSCGEWPEKVLTMQRNWIGRSEGRARAVSRWTVRRRGRHAGRRRSDIEVFTTRIDTIYGATFVVLAPEHPLVQQFARRVAGSGGVPREGRRSSRRRIASARMTGEVEKEGFDTGRTAINPFTGQPVPIWVANFVLVDYGTGAVMGVPGARPARLRVRAQVRPAGHRRRRSPSGAPLDPATTMTEAYAGDGHAGQLRRVRRACRRTRRNRQMTADGRGARHRRAARCSTG